MPDPIPCDPRKGPCPPDATKHLQEEDELNVESPVESEDEEEKED